jgi:flagella basal body P-ring formation protein FlgA
VIALALALGAVAHQDTAALDRAVAAFTGRPIGEEGGARAVVDPRLRLAACPMVAMSWRTHAHDAVVIACSGPDWRLFVPVRMPAQAAGIARAPAASAALAAEKIIKRGDPLVIEAGSDGFSITREGVAMADAAQGQRLMVRVDGAKMPVQAVAIGPGRATLPGWGE